MSRRKNPQYRFGQERNLTIDAVSKSQTKVIIDLGQLLYDLAMFEDDFEKFKKEGGIRVVGNQIWLYPGRVTASWDSRAWEYADPIKIDYYPYIIGIEDDVSNSGGHIIGVTLDGYYKPLYHWGTGRTAVTEWKDITKGTWAGDFVEESKADRFNKEIVEDAFRKNPLPISKEEPLVFIDQVNKDEDLSNADLQNAMLKGSDLSGCSFRNADLRNAVLVDCNLTDCDFTDADLSGAVLVGATVENANFDGCLVKDTMLFDIEKLNTVKRFTPADFDRLGGFVFQEPLGKKGELSQYFYKDVLQPRRYSQDKEGIVLHKYLEYKPFLDRLQKTIQNRLMDMEILGFANNRDILIFDKVKDFFVSSAELFYTKKNHPKFYCFLKHNTFKNLKGINLQGMSYTYRKDFFVGADFSWADFTKVSIEDNAFKGLNFKDAQFYKTTLKGVEFWGSNFDGVDFSQLNLLEECEFAGASLKNVNFQGLQFVDNGFVWADLREANFSGVHSLSENDFTGAFVTDKSLEQYKAYYIGPNTSRMMDLNNRNLDGVNFENSDLAGSSFEDCSLKGACFKNADLSFCRFFGADLTGADFSGATLDDADLENTNLTNANFEGASLEDTQYDNGTVIDNTNFSEAQLLDMYYTDGNRYTFKFK